MIQLKCAELLFLIGVVTCGVAGNLVDYSDRNNKPFFVVRANDDFIGNGVSYGNADDHRFMFSTKSLPADSKLLPTLGNGHIGFTVLSDAVYMNGLYNGHAGLSHRARVPNFANILLADCLRQACEYTLNAKHGYFVVKLVVENQFIVSHFIYAHRFYDRALINQIHIQRLGSRDDINLKLQRNPGNEEADEAARPRNKKESSNNFSNNENFQSTPPPTSHSSKGDEKDDLNFTKNETIDFDGGRLYLSCGHIKELETGGNESNETEQRDDVAAEEEPARQEEDICVLWNHVPEEITLHRTASSISYKFVMAVDTQEVHVRQEMMDVFGITDDELFASHIKEWQMFWNSSQIAVDGDDELFRAIISSIFYLTSCLPSTVSNQPQHPFFGLSPTGLGRGGSDLSDYEGHNFWDTELFMLPPVALLKPLWAQQLLHYRFLMLNAARNYANASGYRGSRFPWESAATGIEVIQPGFEYLAEHQQHITGDISFGLRYYLALSHDIGFMKSEGCQMVAAIADFWASRVTFNVSTQLYDINHVMGPDEDHDNINNNVFTNIIAKLALEFGSFAGCLCGKNEPNGEWLDIATKIKVLYDPVLDYHPQFEGFEVGTEIKQADTVLIGYPLMFAMNHSTRLNDLKIYGDATRDSGPAMSFSMCAINYLDVDDDTKANEMLIKSYKPHVRHPFNVWSEVVEGEDGATNFMTGAGGFLQTIFNGFLGIRLNLHRLEIRNPRLPQNCTNLSFSGISYLQSSFELKVEERGRFLRFISLKDELSLELDDGEKVSIEENATYDISNHKLVSISSSSSPFNGCEI